MSQPKETCPHTEYIQRPSKKARAIIQVCTACGAMAMLMPVDTKLTLAPEPKTEPRGDSLFHFAMTGSPRPASTDDEEPN
jgi:hypothetical protein